MKENILVELKTDSETMRLTLNRGIRLYELADLFYRSSEGYQPVFARVDDEVHDMLHVLNHSCTVEFVDMRSRMARLMYQRTEYFLFRIALYEMAPGVGSVLRYPLNDGMLVEFTEPVDNVNDFAWRIENRIRQLIEKEAVFTRRVLRREQILSPTLRPESVTDEIAELVAESDLPYVYEYSYGSFSEVFVDPLMSSTNGIQVFEIVPYDGNIIIRVPGFENPKELTEYRDDVVLYHSFDSVVKWSEYIGVRYLCDLDRKVRNGEWRDLLLITEAQHEKRIAEIADRIKREGKRIILIAGPSASGKTTFAQRLCIQLRVNGLKPLYMGTDDYFVERHELIPDENGKLNFEDLSAVDLDLFNQQMNALLRGETVDMPVFDFIPGSKRYGTRITHAESDQPIVIEGIHALNPKLTELIASDEKFRIYISPLTALNLDPNNRVPVTDIRLLRRMARDMRSRDRTAEQTLEQWMDVRIGEQKNIFPFNGQADEMFNSSVAYELSVLKPLVIDGLRAVEPTDEKYLEAQRLLRLLSAVRSIRDYSNISNNSIIREFIGGGFWVK